MSKGSGGSKQGSGFGRYIQARASGDEVYNIGGLANGGSGMGQGGGGLDTRARGTGNRGKGLAYSGSREDYRGDGMVYSGSGEDIRGDGWEHSSSELRYNSSSELRYNSSSWDTDSNSISPRNNGSLSGRYGWDAPRLTDARGQQSSSSGDDDGEQQTGSARGLAADEGSADSEAAHDFPPGECLALAPALLCTTVAN